MINKEVIRKNFSDYAAHYDAYSAVQKTCGLKLIDIIQPSRFNNILDVGCGTGAYTSLLRDKFPDAKIKAIDISQSMICVAKRKRACQKVEFIVADAEQLQLGCNFDLISSNVTFQWFDDLEKTLLLYNELLQKEGHIAFSIFGPRTLSELNYSLKQLYTSNVAITSMGFVKKEKIKKILKSIFKKVLITECVINEESSNLSELLRKIKYTGTRGVGVNANGFWTPRTISKLEQIYYKKFSKITATYQAFFCQAVKRKK
ncbi:MAG: malonyl-ACP O-methyltransferase BioC [Candidatus Omnitrophica bacterium]|nr:malonyl-ACP O-methyltransferase BioC [Candidatus Omnitrophota bacterium]